MAVSDWTANPYPVARLKRGLPSSAPPPPPQTEPAIAPRTRFWSARIKILANQIGRLTSPRMRGAALLKDLTGACVAGQSSVPTEVVVQLFIGAAPQTDTVSAGQTLVTAGENVADTSWIDSSIATTLSGQDGFVWRLDGTAGQMFNQPLDYVVYQPEFWITLQLRNPNTVNGMVLDCTMRIYEDCDLDALVLLMG